MPQVTPIRLRLSPQQVRGAVMDGATEADLAQLGIFFDTKALTALRSSYQHSGYAMDAAVLPLNGTGAPIQFLQHILKNVVNISTSARKIDTLTGRTIAGKWEDEEIVQPIVEYTGKASIYSDKATITNSGYNLAFGKRSIVRYIESAQTGHLERQQMGALNQDPNAHYRTAATQSLAIEHNRVGFFGYNDGNCATYGLLNDPNLAPYVTLPAGGAGGSAWSSKTFDEITNDIRILVAKLRTDSGDLISVASMPCVLAVATSVYEFLTVTNQFGQTVLEWLSKTFPKLRVESAPEFDGANGGLNVVYLFAEKVQGLGEEGEQKVIEQFVPCAFKLLGVQNEVTYTRELYSSATAGVMVAVPFAVCRASGV